VNIFKYKHSYKHSKLETLVFNTRIMIFKKHIFANTPAVFILDKQQFWEWQVEYCFYKMLIPFYIQMILILNIIQIWYQ